MYPVCIHVDYCFIIHVFSIELKLIIGRVFLCYIKMCYTKKVVYPSFSNSVVYEILKRPKSKSLKPLSKSMTDT